MTPQQMITIKIKPVRARILSFPKVVRGHYGILRRAGSSRLTSLCIALRFGRILFAVDRGRE